GLGWTDSDGKVTGTVVVTIGGVAVTPSSAILAPSLPGVYQLTLTIPAGITPGTQVPVTVSVDSQPSRPVTIPMQ
ncbi:MAG: hypothetical protein NTY38_20095, partial [Acidobacteria bacterium]|nr:hypothetical protein [Acidobacteriota bacterium]